MTGWHQCRWQLVPLRTLAEFRNGVNFSKANFGRGIKVIGVSDFQNHVRASFENLEQINPTRVVRKEHLLKNGDILFVRSNGNRDLIGRSMFVEGLSEDVTHSAFSIRVRFVSQACYPEFYACLFRSPNIRRRLSLHGGGTNISNLNQDILSRLEVPLPPMSTQCLIASIISAYDDLIDNNTRRIKILEEMAQTIYREWFENFRFPGHQKSTMIESNIGLIPNGWNVGLIRDFCESIDYGFTASAVKDAIGPRFLRITDIVPDTINWRSVPYCVAPDRNTQKYKLLEGDIVIARTGATTGYAKRLNKRHPDSIFASYLVRLRVKPEHSNHMIGLLVESDDYKRFIKANLGGAAQPQANAHVLTSKPIPIPPATIQMEFSRLVEPLLDQMEILQVKNDNLRTTCDLLLPRLVSGEISVINAEQGAIAQGA